MASGKQTELDQHHPRRTPEGGLHMVLDLHTRTGHALSRAPRHALPRAPPALLPLSHGKVRRLCVVHVVVALGIVAALLALVVVHVLVARILEV